MQCPAGQWIDGSDHRWFEDCGPACTLLVFVDDATSQLMQLRFVPSESTFSYFEAMELYLNAYGRPVALAIVLGPMADKALRRFTALLLAQVKSQAMLIQCPAGHCAAMSR